ncbi:MAG: hypothetical protein KKF44_10255 [Nanoarchaeota archaeon]|nr:hypothetical protein [Nanoarchaeota archaeon]
MKHDSGSIVNVIKDIKKDIDNDKKNVFAELEQKVLSEKKMLKKALKKEFISILDENRSRIKEEAASLVDRNKSQNQKKILAFKAKLFSDFLESVNLKFEDYRNRIEYPALIKKVVSDLRKSYGITKIICNEKDMELFSEDADDIEIERSLDIFLGFIAENNRLRIDLSFNRMLEKKKNELSNIFFMEIEPK